MYTWSAATFLTTYSITASNGCSSKQPTAHQTANVKFHFDLQQKSTPSWSARFVLLSARPFAPMSMAHWLPRCIRASDAAHSYLGDSPPISPPHRLACCDHSWCRQDVLNAFWPPSGDVLQSALKTKIQQTCYHANMPMHRCIWLADSWTKCIKHVDRTSKKAKQKSIPTLKIYSNMIRKFHYSDAKWFHVSQYFDGEHAKIHQSLHGSKYSNILCPSSRPLPDPGCF